MSKPSEILDDIIKRLDAEDYAQKAQHTFEIGSLTTKLDETERKRDEYKQMAYLARNTLKRIARSISTYRFNANKATDKQLRDKIKTIRIILEEHDTKVIKKDYEVYPD